MTAREDPALAAPEAAATKKKKSLPLLILQTTVTLATMLWLFSSVDWERIGATWAYLRYHILWLPPVILLCGTMVSAARWSFLLYHLKHAQPFLVSLRFYLIANFYGLILPGVIGGDAIRITLAARRQTGPIAMIVTSTLIERILGLVMVLFIASTALIFAPPNLLQTLGLPSDRTLLALMGLGLVGTIFLASFCLRLVPATMTTKRSSDGNVVALFRSILQILCQVPMRAIYVVAGLSGFFQLIDIIATWVLGLALGIELPLSAYLMIMPIVYISTVLPISIGGLGVRESVLTLLLKQFGAETSVAVMLAFTVYINRIAVGLFGMCVQWLLSHGVGQEINENQVEQS